MTSRLVAGRGGFDMIDLMGFTSAVAQGQADIDFAAFAFEDVSIDGQRARLPSTEWHAPHASIRSDGDISAIDAVIPDMIAVSAAADTLAAQTFDIGLATAADLLRGIESPAAFVSETDPDVYAQPGLIESLSRGDDAPQLSSVDDSRGWRRAGGLTSEAQAFDFMNWDDDAFVLPAPERGLSKWTTRQRA